MSTLLTILALIYLVIAILITILMLIYAIIYDKDNYTFWIYKSKAIKKNRKNMYSSIREYNLLHRIRSYIFIWPLWIIGIPFIILY